MEEEKLTIKFIGTVTGAKGTCHANHKTGQTFELNCYDSGGFVAVFITISFPTSVSCSLAGNIPGGIRIR